MSRSDGDGGGRASLPRAHSPAAAPAACPAGRPNGASADRSTCGGGKEGEGGGERGAPCGARRPAANTRFSRAERPLFSADATHQYTFRISSITTSTNSLK